MRYEIAIPHQPLSVGVRFWRAAFVRDAAGRRDGWRLPGMGMAVT
jgi:hypothetical protein